MRKMFLYPYKADPSLATLAWAGFECRYSGGRTNVEVQNFIKRHLDELIESAGIKGINTKVINGVIMVYVFVEIPQDLVNPDDYIEDIRYKLGQEIQGFRFIPTDLLPVVTCRTD